MSKVFVKDEIRLVLDTETTIEDVQDFTAEVVDAYGDDAQVGAIGEQSGVFLVAVKRGD